MSRLTGSWPLVLLHAVPGSYEALTLADRVRRSVLGADVIDAPLLDLKPLAAAGRLELHEARLSAERGMQEAMLIPLAGDRFAVTVDAAPPGGWDRVPLALRGELGRHRARFRIGHEIGHTFFYARGRGTPERVLRGTPAQEVFCDAFAQALLVPPRAARLLEPSPASILELHGRYDVSVEVAARALSLAHPDARVSVWFDSLDDSGVRLQWASSPTTRPGRLAHRPTYGTRISTKALPFPRRQLLTVER